MSAWCWGSLCIGLDLSAELELCCTTTLHALAIWFLTILTISTALLVQITIDLSILLEFVSIHTSFQTSTHSLSCSHNGLEDLVGSALLHLVITARSFALLNYPLVSTIPLALLPLCHLMAWFSSFSSKVTLMVMILRRQMSSKILPRPSMSIYKPQSPKFLLLLLWSLGRRTTNVHNCLRRCEC